MRRSTPPCFCQVSALFISCKFIFTWSWQEALELQSGTNRKSDIRSNQRTLERAQTLLSGSVRADTHGGPEARRWGSVLPGLTRAVPHHLAVDGAADTVVQLDVQFGQDVGWRRSRGSGDGGLMAKS